MISARDEKDLLEQLERYLKQHPGIGIGGVPVVMECMGEWNMVIAALKRSIGGEH